MTSFAQDRVSGSSDVGRGFLDALEQWTGADCSTSTVMLRASLLGWLKDVQRAQPTMAIVHQLAARALETADASIAREDRAADARAALARSCAAERSDLADQQRAVARVAASLLVNRDSWIATLSASGTVRDAFLEAHAAGLVPKALIGESRPGREGRTLAAALAAAGIPVWIVVDALLPLLLTGARAVWIGADAVTERGVINKIGSYGVALAAREHSVPVYALAARRKFLPASTASLRIAEMPPDEVWRDRPAGVEARNAYFELVPLELLRGVVVEDGVLGASEVRTVAVERALPGDLAGA